MLDNLTKIVIIHLLDDIQLHKNTETLQLWYNVRNLSTSCTCDHPVFLLFSALLVVLFCTSRSVYSSTNKAQSGSDSGFIDI